MYLEDWSTAELVDPRGAVAVESAADAVDTWVHVPRLRKVGFFSNKKPNADAMLDQIKTSLAEIDPGLEFAYGSKEPLAENADQAVLASLTDCDVVFLASAECGGCTSWVARDYISLQRLGVPCMLIATDRFRSLAEAVLARGGVEEPRLIVPQHPVSGIPAERAQAKIRALMDDVATELGLNTAALVTEGR
ncbi:MAG: hypothetical protein QM626_13735 [Microbacterium sp.]|uniref:UGSC family (seleno)protein n=1 Tax=Microbacterium sp. TaxID=51671 RepID=UPI0039E3AA2F